MLDERVIAEFIHRAEWSPWRMAAHTSVTAWINGRQTAVRWSSSSRRPGSLPLVTNQVNFCSYVVCSGRGDGRFPTASEDCAAYGAGARDALANVCRVHGPADHGPGDRDFAPPVLLGRNREREHASPVHHSDSVLAGYGAHRLQIRDAGPEWMEP